MKNLKKILIVLCVLTFLFAGCVIAVLAEDEYTGTLADYEALVAAAESAATADTKYEAVIAMSEYLANTPVDPVTEGYDAVIDRADAAIVAAAELLLGKIDANIETTLKTASNKVAINKLNRVLSNCPLNGESVSLADVEAKLADLVAAHERAVAKNLAAVEESNSISDYDFPVYAKFDAESVAAHDVTKVETIGGFTFNPKSTKNKLGVGQEANGNKYLYTSYQPSTETDNNTYFEFGLSAYSRDNGYVFEFDIMTLDNIPENDVNIEAGGFNMPDGRGFPAYYLSIDKDGSFITGKAPNSEYGNPQNVLPNAMVPGEWIHIAIVFNNADFTYTLIVEGEVLSTYTAKYKNTTFDLSKGVLRFSSKSESGSVAMDNFVFYSGSNYRTLDKFSTMTEDEQFVYYSNYLTDSSRDVNGRNVAYEMAAGLIKNYWIYTNVETGEGDYTDYAKANPELMSAVDAYLAFDFEELLSIARAENLASYVVLVNDLNAMDRSIENVSNRTNKLVEVENFALKYANLIDKDIDNDNNGEKDYAECSRIVETVRKEIDYDKNAEVFIRYMNRFSVVTALSAMQRYYDRAHALVIEGVIDIDLATNPDHEDRANFEEFVKAYETYLVSYDLIYDMVRKDNSSKIVACMGFIDGYTTEEEWMENYDEMNKYINIVKDSILVTEEDGTTLYDENYEGVAEAVEFFNVIYAFFYNVHQEMHISYISEILGLISSTEAYVEKMGMVSMIDRYVADNDLDYEDARIISLLNSLETVRSELQVREEDYGKILIQNSVYFVNIVEDMRTAETYPEQKKYYEKASLLYFNLDITVEGAANAVAIYDEYKAKLTMIEESSIGFLDSFNYYQACVDADERYAALVECYYNSQFAEMSYDGVTEAMEIFQDEYDSYMNYVNAVNEEIVAAGNVVGSLRTNCGVTPIIAIIIKKIYGI